MELVIKEKNLASGRNILFLLRTYNDIDHIVPVIWKTTEMGLKAYVIFVDRDYCNDYRLRFIFKNGASQIENKVIQKYFRKLRNHVRPRLIKRCIDRLVAYTFGLKTLRKYNIQSVVNEWSGPNGRAMAEFYLRPAKAKRIPIYSLPHGYHTWINPLFNTDVTKYWEHYGALPDFSNRNWFTKYVVQAENVKQYYENQGVNSEKLVVLGSARYCQEWHEINLQLAEKIEISDNLRRNYLITFFLPHWNYNVDRSRLIDTLKTLSKLHGVTLIVKIHTRGSSQLNQDEIAMLSNMASTVLADEVFHSTALVKISDFVICLGSSIGFEALRQGKLICNPTYLHQNCSILDDDNLVYQANDEAALMKVISSSMAEQAVTTNGDKKDDFFRVQLDGGTSSGDVLGEYVKLVSSI